MQFIKSKVQKKKLIILNGTANSGKTSIANNLQILLDRPTYILSMDNFLEMSDKRYPFEQIVPALLSSMMFSVGAYMKNQDNVIMDCVFDAFNNESSNKYLFEIFESLRIFDVFELVQCYKVKVHAEDEVLNFRESQRLNRRKGLANYQKHRIHNNIDYDIEIDTSELSSSQAALKLFSHISSC